MKKIINTIGLIIINTIITLTFFYFYDQANKEDLYSYTICMMNGGVFAGNVCFKPEAVNDGWYIKMHK